MGACQSKIAMTHVHISPVERYPIYVLMKTCSRESKQRHGPAPLTRWVCRSGFGLLENATSPPQLAQPFASRVADSEFV